MGPTRGPAPGARGLPPAIPASPPPQPAPPSSPSRTVRQENPVPLPSPSHIADSQEPVADVVCVGETMAVLSPPDTRPLAEQAVAQHGHRRRRVQRRLRTGRTRAPGRLAEPTRRRPVRPSHPGRTHRAGRGRERRRDRSGAADRRLLQGPGSGPHPYALLPRRIGRVPDGAGAGPAARTPPGPHRASVGRRRGRLRQLRPPAGGAAPRPGGSAPGMVRSSPST
jgi:hypothetical protein